MKKFLLLLLFVTPLYAKPANKALVGVSLTPAEKAAAPGSETQFGGAYLWGDIIQGNNYVTAAGKIYYRLNSVADGEEESQKIDLKRAYIKVRPAGNDILEVAVGKLYSYYLPGAFFNLSEIYTGNSRWGKTGLGAKFEAGGFSGGLGLPVTETYTTFSDSFILSGALTYNFASLKDDLPLTTGFSFLNEFIEDDFSFSLSALYTPKFTGFISKASVFAAYSYKAEAYAAHKTFKNVDDYTAKKSYADPDSFISKNHLFSLNLKMNLGSVQLIQEAEAGHSTKGHLIPLYSGTQLLIPFTEHVAVKPRFYYYGVLNTDNSDLSRQTFEFYPRLWLTFGKCTVSAGTSIMLKQCSQEPKEPLESSWYWGYSIPLYAEYKF